MLIRRHILAGLAAAACGGKAHAEPGPRADFYGAPDYPVPARLAARLEGNPWTPKYRVGAFTHLDRIYDTRTVTRAAEPWAFKRATFEEQALVDDYLAHHPSPAC